MTLLLLLPTALALTPAAPPPGPPPPPPPPPGAEAAVEQDHACDPEAVFPGTSWRDRTAEVAQAHADRITALEAYIFPEDLDWDDEERKGLRTDGLVIIHKGELVYERYEHGYDADSRHLAWSMSKTATALLFGIASESYDISPDDSICEHLEGLPEQNCKVTLDHMLTFSSGFDWLETYEGYSPTQSSVLAMLYGEGQPSMGTFVASHGVRDEPGTRYMYSSGDTNVVTHALDNVLRPKQGDDWPEDLLLRPLGMDSAVWERDGADVIVGSSYLWATPRDLARLGLLIEQKGCWEGEPLLAEQWIDRMAEVNDAIRTSNYDRWWHNVQGRQLWLNQPIPEVGLDRPPWPSVPQDAMMAKGHWGQTITAIPSWDLVVVRTGDDRSERPDLGRMLPLAYAVATGEDPGELAPEGAPDTVAEPQLPPWDRRYDTGLLRVATGFSAKETCSCVFVAGKDADWCAEWTRVSPDVAKAKVDLDAKRVKSKALGVAPSVAEFVDETRGCRLVR